MGDVQAGSRPNPNPGQGSGSDDPRGELELEPSTLVLGNEVFDVPFDPLLDLLNDWEEYRRRGEDLPPDWAAALEPELRVELNRRIERRKRLIALLGLGGPGRATPKLRTNPSPRSPASRHSAGSAAAAWAPFTGRATWRSIGSWRSRPSPRAGSPRADQRERFRDEARAVARLHHPNIIAIHAIGEHEGQPYLTLEFAERGSLARAAARASDAPERGRRPDRDPRPRRARRAPGRRRPPRPQAEQHPDHRRRRPQDRRLRPRQADGRDAGRTITGQVLGSPSFMAPEQAEGHSGQVGPAADIYALGSILYQSLTGRPPFLGESQIETLKLVVSNDVVPPCRLRPDVPRDLETICLRCLEKEPSRRYADALALAEDLERHLDGRPILARRAGALGTRLAMVPPQPRPGRGHPRRRGARPDPDRRSRGRRRRLPRPARPDRRRPRPPRAIRGRRRGPARPRLEAGRQADRSRAEMKAVLEFFQNKVLAAARPKDQEGGLGRDVSLRTAFDTAESGIDEGLSRQARAGGLDPRRARPDLLLSRRPGQGRGPARAGRTPCAAGSSAPTTPTPSDRPTTWRTCSSTAVSSTWPSPRSPTPSARRRATLGPDHPDTIGSKHNLAMAYQAAGRIDESLALYREALARRRAILGPDHPDTLFSMNNLASCSREAGRFDEALPLYEEALKRRRVVLGPDHPETLVSMNNLANFYRELGRYPESIDLLREALPAAGVEPRPRPPRHAVLDGQPRAGASRTPAAWRTRCRCSRTRCAADAPRSAPTSPTRWSR